MRLASKALLRGAIAVAALAAGPLIGAGVAQAAAPSVVQVSGDSLAFRAGAGQTNIVFVTFDGSRYTVRQTAALSAGPGCVLVATNQASCTSLGVTRMRIEVLDGDDIVNNNTATPSVIRGVADGDLGQDIINGGSGSRDLVDYSKRTAPLVIDADEGQDDDGELGEGDTVDENVEDIFGGSAGDILMGNGSANRIAGFGGDDRLFGFDGDDSLDGGAGFNFVDGGNGADFCSTSINPGGVLTNCNP